MPRHFGGLGTGRQTERAKAFVVLGVVVVLVCFLVAVLSLSQGTASNDPAPAAVQQTQEAPVKMVDVLVPVKDIEAGLPLDPGLFRKESRPQVGISPRAVRDFEEIHSHYSRSLIVAGQPLHRDYITNVRPANLISANIPEGYRAVTINVDAKSSVEGFVRPGSRVDVMWASTIRGMPSVTRIVKNAKVLSAERNIDPKAPPGAPVPSTVTLLVTSQDASKINLAQTTGSITLQLRGDEDKGSITGEDVESININQLMTSGSGDPTGKECTSTLMMGGIKYCVRGGKLEVAAE